VEEKARDEQVTAMETVVAAFDNSFATWKPEVEASLGSIKLVLPKLKTYFDQDAKGAGASKLGVLQFGSTSECPLTGSVVDGPNGHHVDQHYWDCGFRSVYTLTHDPVKGTMPPPHFTSNSIPNAMFTPHREHFRSTSALSQGQRN
jgi:hypothetical protein